MSLPLILTFGFEGRTLEELDAEARKYAAFILDVRLIPSSDIAGWQLRELLARFGESRYSWIRELGNKARKQDRVELASADRGYARLGAALATHGAVILLCACRDLERCHRRAIAEEFTAGAEHLCGVLHLWKSRPQEGLAFA